MLARFFCFWGLIVATFVSFSVKVEVDLNLKNCMVGQIGLVPTNEPNTSEFRNVMRFLYYKVWTNERMINLFAFPGWRPIAALSLWRQCVLPPTPDKLVNPIS